MTLSRGKQFALAVLAVLACGAGMLFHRGTSLPIRVEGEARKALTRRLPSPRGVAERGQLLQTFEEKMPRVPTAATTVDADARSRDFPAHPSRSFHPASALFEPADNRPPTETPDDGLLGDARAPVALVDPPPPRTHLVVDGDTLAKLAARYLGSSDRYGEIFAANRPLLTKPDLLPIGAVLVIPPRQRPAPPVEMSLEDTASALPPDDDQMPQLDFDNLPADSPNPPAARDVDSDDATNDESLVPVPKPAEE